MTINYDAANLGVGIVGIVVTFLIYSQQRKDAKAAEERGDFKHRARFRITGSTDGFNYERDVLVQRYEAKMDKDGNLEFTMLPNRHNVRYNALSMYLQNIGESDVEQLEIAIADQKNECLINKHDLERCAILKTTGWHIAFNGTIRAGETIKLTVEYPLSDFIQEDINNTLILLYRDTQGNMCQQPLYPMRWRIGPSVKLNSKKWRELTDPISNIEQWKQRLSQ